ncbi:LOW QUALITY PROTEIN: metabotropic glutamate receptor 1-like [Acanthochromis polyacanthus]|uniref:LOW QUALITY PROTEIN: metabotropic glutamate receptor 1-like n=1 Tax=Acanthochromis polyacanthus TaxID=80966 RepID=UPI002234BD26|nr:LOW QUALITY PROTEIN: metabotropic glutamate receptor 1-like [Acanthochromis polyacanthus]
MWLRREDEGRTYQLRLPRHSPHGGPRGRLPACGLIKARHAGALSGGMPVYHQAHPSSRSPSCPLHLDPFDEGARSPLEEEEMENEQFGPLHGYMYNNARSRLRRIWSSQLAGGVSALMPPSPFRDCSGTPVSPFPNSPVSESILCTPRMRRYASVILRDYKQSSSTL